MATVQIALLRAINLGAHNKVSMADLRALLTDLGFEDVRTILQTGNLIFRSRGPTGAKLEALLETEAKKRLGLDTDFIVRSAAQWEKLIAANPFPDEAKSDPSHLVVIACKDAPKTPLKVTGARREQVQAKGSDLYVTYPDGIGRSKLKIDVVGTARNWNTVLKIAETGRELARSA